MAGYTKLFADILDSSIWDEDVQTRIVWVTLLALSDADGYVRGSVGWLAGKAKVPNSSCELAIQKFSLPDPKSRTLDNEGRRVEVLSDGWLILNYLAFRDRLSSDRKASATRERVRKHRERYQALRNTPSVTRLVSASASESSSGKGVQGETKTTPIPFAVPELPALKVQCAKIGLSEGEAEKFFNYYTANGWKVGRNPMRSWRHALANWKLNAQTYNSPSRGPRPIDHTKGF
jgi:hypothetical protein